MDWIISATTIVAMELTIRKHWLAWVLTIGNQALWLAFILGHRAWGLLPLNLFMWFMAARGLYVWTRKSSDSQGTSGGKPRTAHDHQPLGPEVH